MVANQRFGVLDGGRIITAVSNKQTQQKKAKTQVEGAGT